MVDSRLVFEFGELVKLVEFEGFEGGADVAGLTRRGDLNFGIGNLEFVGVTLRLNPNLRLLGITACLSSPSSAFLLCLSSSP